MASMGYILVSTTTSTSRSTTPSLTLTLRIGRLRNCGLVLGLDLDFYAGVDSIF